VPPRFPHDIQRTVLRDMFRSSGLHIRDCHTLWSAVPGKFCFTARRLNSPTTPHFPEGIRFELYRFHSPLLTVSRLISFPAPTEMFQFGAFPIITDHYGEVPFGNPGFIGSMHLPRAYRSLARPSSALEPSHPPDSITPVTPNQVQLASNIQHLYMTSFTCASAQAIRPSPIIYLSGALDND
jgi:hypothetical protein